MKSVLASVTALALLLFSPLSLAAEAAAEGEKLLVITPRGVEPRISAYAEIVDTHVVVEANPDAEGNQFEVYPSPKGQLSSPDMSGMGFLTLQSNDSTSTPLYALRFQTWPPDFPPDKYNYFFATSAGCGTHCGGPQLVYDETREDDEFGGAWLVAPREEGGGGYFVRWYDGAGEVPEGHTRVYLMREAVE